MSACSSHATSTAKLFGTDTAEGSPVWRRYGSGTEDQPDLGTSMLPERPEFPPPSLNLVPAFAADLPQKQGSDMLVVCAFLQSFSGLLGLTTITVDNLLAAGVETLTASPLYASCVYMVHVKCKHAHSGKSCNKLQ